MPITKTVCNLIYTGLGQKESGSPVNSKITESNVKCDDMETFSQNYYAQNQRIMRLSKNIAIYKHLAEDRIDSDGIRHELSHVEINGKKYKIQNILKHRDSSLKVILDCQELR